MLLSSIAVKASQTVSIFYHFQVQILAVLQDFSGFNFFYQFSSSIVNCNSGLLRIQLSSTSVSSSFVLVIPDYSGYN
jgi:hypothetical protein